jgi:hypothetical protein
MSKGFEIVDSQPAPKAKWVTPVVRKLNAGAAEINTGAKDDGDPGVAKDNS